MSTTAPHAVRLPAALAPWATELRIFPRDVALSLGPLVSRLASVLGPLRRTRHAGDGDVDGFDGLARRGSYERLLITEWLLADEAPQEFLRRAANGEHTFLRLARPQPDGERASHVLFDAGPSQLGSPRVAHIAALVVLARRAAEAGARFSWGLLQEPARDPFTEVTPATVAELLGARTASEATSFDLRAWLNRLGAPVAADDLWLVGGKRLGALDGAFAAARLVVADVLEPEMRRVSAEVWHGHRRLSSVVLDLPDNQATTRLLRDPFGAGASPRVAPGLPLAPRPTSNLVFSDNGLRLFARGASGVVDYPVPNSPRAPAGRARVHAVAGSRSVIAAGRAGRGLVFVSATRGGWTVHARRLPEMAGNFTASAEIEIPRGVGPLTACHLHSAPGRTSLVFRHDRLLIRRGPMLLGAEHPPVADVLSKDVLATWATRDAVVYVERASGVARLVRMAAEKVVADLGIGEEAWFGYGGPAADPLFGLVALAENSGTIRVRHARGTTAIRVPSDLRAMGVTRNLHRSSEPGVVVLEGDGRTVKLVGQSWTRRLPKASAPIETLVVSPSTAAIAWTTTRGELVVHSVDHDADVLRLRLATEGTTA